MGITTIEKDNSETVKADVLEDVAINNIAVKTRRKFAITKPRLTSHERSSSKILFIGSDIDVKVGSIQSLNEEEQLFCDKLIYSKSVDGFFVVNSLGFNDFVIVARELDKDIYEKMTDDFDNYFKSRNRELRYILIAKEQILSIPDDIILHVERKKKG